MIDKQQIARLVPHAGTMCLLDAVVEWDGGRIHCTTTTHRANDNPLRHNGRLGILAGVEYAAQAMALHGALAASDAECTGAARSGFLASLRSVTCHADRLDLLPAPIIVEAERLHGNTDRAIYRFALSHRGSVLLSGRAAVVLLNAPK